MTAEIDPIPAATDARPAAPSPGSPMPSLGTARMADGTILRTLRWDPDGEPWAVAEVVHGLGEHGGRYGSVAGAMTAAGIETWAYDLRGNGGSGGRRVYVDRWSVLHDDLEARLKALRALHPGRPLVLYGHSLGGLVACGYVLSPVVRHQPDLLVLSAPALDDNLPGWQRPVARALVRFAPKLRIRNGLPDGGRSRDPEVGARADADPLCAPATTVRWGAEAYGEQDRLRALLPGLASMPVPTYVLHGSADPIVPAGATAVFEGMDNATRRLHEGLRHECHHEPEHADVLAEVVAWVEATAPAPASAAV
jgi:alpha-beta hydrolase superfamily lysophospholipase